MTAALNQTWVILIPSWGAYLFEGTEADAEASRKHKANWEQGLGLKRLATSEEINTKVVDRCLNHPNFKVRHRYVCKCGKCD